MIVSSTQKLVVHIVLVEVYQTLAFLTPGQLHPEYGGDSMMESILEQCFGDTVQHTWGQGSHLNIKGTFRLLEPNMYF